jgi:hypothetical protein
MSRLFFFAVWLVRCKLGLTPQEGRELAIS